MTETRAFQAHVTVARKVRTAPATAAIAPVPWPARDFCLVESTAAPAGSEYRVIARWPLVSPGSVG
jgi:2'-5' RNA ligase